MVIFGQRMLSLTESKLLNALSVDGLEISLNLCFHNLSNKQTAAGELMKGYSFILLNLIFFTNSPPIYAASEGCSDDGVVSFLCGPVSPEDLLEIPGSPWVIASGMEDDGYLYFANSQELTSTAVYPSSDIEHRLDKNRFGNCPGPQSTGFRPHGLSMVVGDNRIHSLLVVRHGSREAIEVFEVDETQELPKITWVGCVLAPEDVVFNSVVATPEGGMAATHFQLPLGHVYEWSENSGWSQVPGSEIEGPNGIELSADGEWYYIAGWGSRSLVKLSRGRPEIVKSSVEVSHHIDNLRWSIDGSILAAGHIGRLPSSIFGCLNQSECDGVSTRVTRIDVNNLTARQIIDYPSNSVFMLGTVAIEVGNEIWVGGIGGADRIARFEYR